MLLDIHPNQKIAGLSAWNLVSFTIEFDNVIRRTAWLDGYLNLLRNFSSLVSFALLAQVLRIDDFSFAFAL